MIKKAMLSQTFVEISLKIFPAIPLIKWKGTLSNTNISRMKKPYKRASLFPLFLFPFVKNDTVKRDHWKNTRC